MINLSTFSGQGQVLVSTDPVAMDTVILEIVNRHRRANGLGPVERETRPRPRPPKFLATAARLGLGIDDRARIDVVSRALSSAR